MVTQYVSNMDKYHDIAIHTSTNINLHTNINIINDPYVLKTHKDIHIIIIINYYCYYYYRCQENYPLVICYIAIERSTICI